jgi:hypothetical protein
VNTDEDLSIQVAADGIHRTGGHALAATDAELLPDHHPASLPLAEGPGGTGRGTGSRIAGQAMHCHKPGGQAPGGMDPDTGATPGNPLMDKPGASQRTRMAANTLVHPRGDQLFHDVFFSSCCPGCASRRNNQTGSMTFCHQHMQSLPRKQEPPPHIPETALLLFKRIVFPKISGDSI